MGIRCPLVISFVLHIILLVLFNSNIGDIFSNKIKDSGYAVFDYVEIGKKTKAPLLSQEEGKLSKKKSKVDEKETVKQTSQPKENAKTENTPSPEKVDKTEGTAVAINKKKKSTISKNKTDKKQSTKDKNKSTSTSKAVVNLRKNKRAKNNDPKSAKKSFDSLLDGAIAKGDNENSGIKAEEVGETLTATQIDLIRQTIRKCWHFPAGLRNAEDLVVDIKMELDPSGTVKSAEIVDKNRMLSDADYRTAAENAYRAVLDPKCNPLPLPKERYNEWKDLELSFNPKDMFG